MEYIALYRRYRPKSFSEITGQNNIVTILKNQISTEKTTHAYLFCGTRGTGKTSAAKIFAKAVNCENHTDGEPCHKCNTCKIIENNNVMDITEIDAASNRGVDEIRELREKVKYPPSIGSYKVYIIDEVHMLTTEAFNALLKTLEEPPKHVIFILATTEPNKLPTTILSRCQRFNFKRIEIRDILSRMEHICNELNIQIEENTLKLIAKNSDGAMRDALSILEQCLSISNDNNVDYESVKNLLGISDDHLVYALIGTVVNKDVHSALDYLDEAYRNGKEISQLLNQMILCFRDMLILKITGANENLIEANEENTFILKELGSTIDSELITYFIESLADMENKIKYSTLPKVLMEVILMKLCSVSGSKDTIENKIKLQHVEPVKYKESKQEELKVQEVPRIQKIDKSEMNPTYVDNTKFDFSALCTALKKEKPLLGTALEMGKFIGITENQINIQFNDDDTIHVISVNKNKAYIEEKISKLFGTPYFINCAVQNKEDDSFVKLTKEVFGDDKVYIVED